MEVLDLKQVQNEQIKEEKKRKSEGKKRAIEKIRKHNKAVYTTYFVLFLAVCVGVAYGGEQYANWRAEHQWQFPAKWVGFVVEIKKQVSSPVLPLESTKELSKEEIIANSRHPKQISDFWMLESTKGTNDKDPNALHNYCKKLGETNEFGFGGMQNKICFKTFQEAVSRVDQWLDDQDARTYCYYNKGERVNDCDYVANANKL